MSKKSGTNIFRQGANAEKFMTWVGGSKFKPEIVDLFRDTCTDEVTGAEAEYKLSKVFWTDTPRFEDLYNNVSSEPPLTCA